jgi:hypothetical protein
MLLQINLVAVILLTVVVVYQFVMIASTTSKADETIERANRVMKVIHLKTQGDLNQLAAKTETQFNELENKVSSKEICVDDACLRKTDIVKIRGMLGNEYIPTSKFEQNVIQEELNQVNEIPSTIKYNTFNFGMTSSDIRNKPYCCIDANNQYTRHNDECNTLIAKCTGKAKSVCLNEVFQDHCEWKDNTCVNKQNAPTFTVQVPCEAPNMTTNLPLLLRAPQTPKPVFFTDFNGQGIKVDLGIGEYRDLGAHPKLLPLKKNIKSFIITQDWQVSFYTGLNFTGSEITFMYPGSYNITSSLLEKIRSINIVRLVSYTTPDSLVTPNLPPLKININSKVTLFTEHNFKGNYMDVPAGFIEDLGDYPNFDNKIKSFILPEDLEITFYQGLRFTRNRIKFSYPGQYNLDGPMILEQIKSIEIRRKKLT